MEIITRQHAGESAELLVRGRLDGASADHLAADLDRLVREGTHRLWLDLSEVTYLSSNGVGVLLRFLKQVKALGGSLKVFSPSAPAREVLELSHLVPILVGAPPGRPGHRKTSWEQRAPRRGAVQERGRFSVETFDYPDTGPLRCRTVGDPSLIRGCRFREADCRAVSLGGEAFALGVGALGRDYDDCRGRFGELLAAGGVAAYLPTDGANVPDYLVLGNRAAPGVRFCYGLVFEGSFSRLTRFEAGKGVGAVTLTELAEAALEGTDANAVGMVLVAQSAGLMGAALRRSPAEAAEAEAPFAYPEVREWLTFTGERAYRSSTILAVGVAARGEPGPLAAQVRPLGRGPQPAGHFHAAAFSPRTLPVGEIDLQETVAALFEEQHLQGLLHLLADYREPAGLGESEFVRGACWAAPLGPVEVERTSP